MKADIIPTEEDEQMAVIDWAEKRTSVYPALKLLHHIPNGGKRTITEAKRFKAMGVKAGVPDLFLPVPRGRYHGLWIEMKRTQDGKVSENQKWWIGALNSLGYSAQVAYGAEQAIRQLEEYLNLK